MIPIGSNAAIIGLYSVGRLKPGVTERKRKLT
jgi:hypothetical protein